jgi:hypothetical protein
MTEITVNGHKTIIPTTWNELSKKQLLRVADFLDQRLTEFDFKVKMFFVLSGWKLNEYGVKIGRKYHNIVAWQFVELSKKAAFLLTETETKDERITFIQSKLTCNCVPEFRCRFRRYYGPADRLYNLTFGEYIVADNYYTRYLETRNVEFLDKLMATLYRRKDKEYDPESSLYRGDKREPFNSHTVEARAKKLSRMDINLKLAVMLLFQGCKNHLSNVFREVFTPSGGSPSRFGALSLVDALTNGDVTKSETVRNQYLWDVMVHLENTIRTHRELKEKQKNG